MKIILNQIRSILVKVWQKKLTPRQAYNAILHQILLNNSIGFHYCDVCRFYESNLHNILNELQNKNITVNEVEDDLKIMREHREKHRKNKKLKLVHTS